MSKIRTLKKISGVFNQFRRFENSPIKKKLMLARKLKWDYSYEEMDSHCEYGFPTNEHNKNIETGIVLWYPKLKLLQELLSK